MPETRSFSGLAMLEQKKRVNEQYSFLLGRVDTSNSRQMKSDSSFTFGCGNIGENSNKLPLIKQSVISMDNSRNA